AALALRLLLRLRLRLRRRLRHQRHPAERRGPFPPPLRGERRAGELDGLAVLAERVAVDLHETRARKTAEEVLEGLAVDRGVGEGLAVEAGGGVGVLCC